MDNSILLPAKPHLLLLVSLCFTVFLTGCGEATETAKTQFSPMVKIIKVASSSNALLRKFPAQVEANRYSHLAFRVSGTLNDVKVKAGDHVNKGQLLAKLDATDFIIKLNESQARYRLAQSTFARTKQLLDKKLISQSAFDEANAQLLMTRAALAGAQSALNYTDLKAPYAGVVAKVHSENYQNVNAQQLVLDLQNNDNIDISIQVPEHIFATLDKNLNYQPTVSFAFQAGTKYALSLKEWDTQADPTTLSYKVVFSLPTPKGINILPGMTGTVSVVLHETSASKPSFTLPVSAVFSAEDLPAAHNTQFVWQVLADMSVKRIAVVVGEIDKEGIVINEGLTGNEQIIAAGVHYVRAGMTVRPWINEKGL